MQFVVFEKINKDLFIQNCTRKNHVISINNIDGKIRDGVSKLSTSKARASSAKIIHSNRAVGQNNRVRSKQ